MENTKESTVNPVVPKKSYFQKYGESWKTMIPVRFGTEKDKASIPHSKLGLFSFVSLNWMSSIMWKASRHGIKREDIPMIREKESIEANGKRLKQIWNNEVRSRGHNKASLTRCIWRLNRTCLLIASVTMIATCFFQIAGPAFVLKNFLDYLADNTSPLSTGGYLVAALSLAQFLKNMAFNLFWIIGTCAGVRAQGAIQMIIYSKVLTIRTVGEKLAAEVLHEIPQYMSPFLRKRIPIARKDDTPIAYTVVNYCTNDMERILHAMQFSATLVGAPFMWSINVVFCYMIMGPWSLLGNFLVLVYFPIMAFVGKQTSQYRMKSIKITDSRIRLMSQVLSNIKFIKMYAWEEAFSKRIEIIRKAEENILRKACFLQSAGWTAIPIIIVICPLTSFIGHILSGGNLTASVAFTILSQYTSLIIVVTTVPMAVKAFCEGLASCQRIQQMLLVPDVIPPTDESMSDTKNSVFIREAHFAWPTTSLKQHAKAQPKAKTKDKESKEKTNNKSQSEVNLYHSNVSLSKYKTTLSEEAPEFTTVVENIHLNVKKGLLIGICGNVGSGKSTLLAGISGEAMVTKGTVHVQGKVALVTQQAWLFNATLQDNILFGQPYDEHRYNMVVEVCCLNTDFALLPQGDQTEIGEKGSNLSGGQKQRVNLARALYSDRDIYILDDVLSAVDAKVALHIFDNCIKTAMKGKTVLMVTHIMHLFKKCDYVVLMKNGKIAEQGTHDELIRKGRDYYELFTSEKKERDNMKGGSDEIGNVEHVDKNIVKEKSDSTDATLIKDEIDPCKKITWPTFLYYGKACGGYCSVLFMFATVLLFNLAILFNQIWLQMWLDAGDGNNAKSTENSTTSRLEIQLLTNATIVPNMTVEYYATPNFQMEAEENITLNPDLHMYLLVFGLSAIFITILGVIKSITVGKVMLTGASQLHRNMFDKIIHCTMSFFDTTPLARILSRFSRDIDELDMMIPFQTEYVAQASIQFLLQFLLIGILFPWYMVVVAIILGLFAMIDMYLSASIRESKKSDNLLRPPILVHMVTTIQGLPLIRVFQKQKMFIDKFYKLVNTHLSAVLLFQLSPKWLGFRVDLLGWVTLTLTAIMIWLLKGTISVGVAGLAMSQILRATVIVAIVIRWKSELLARLISVERITHYCKNLEEEAPGIIQDNRPSQDWPKRGSIRFQSVNLRYRENLPLVLQNFTVHIKSGEKVGIVGRTGAGKSSIIGVLLRLVEPCEGSITIDGVDTATIGLQDLRTKIAVIPQDPVLFEGTIQWNLDPFNKCTDEDIWAALDQANLKTKVMNEPLKLQTEIHSDGCSLSLGERQLFCLARALLRKNKIVILDEATASVDVETDKLIQNTICKSFADCTVLTIAHRLNTVMNYEKIITMESGKVAIQSKVIPTTHVTTEFHLENILVDGQNNSNIICKCMQVIEFDSPQNLMARGSIFQSMVKCMSDACT